MKLVLAETGALPRVQQRELELLGSEVRILVGRLNSHPLLRVAVLAELLGAEVASLVPALAERPDLVTLVRQQLRYGPPASAAPCNVLNAGYGGI